jgi:predicted lipoprotein with Yx(FWY)xxD motif
MTPSDSVWIRPSLLTSQQRRLVRLGFLPAVVLAGSLSVSTSAGAAPAREVVTTAHINGLGSVLVSAHRPLYVFAKDRRGHSSCTGICTKVWPPLIVSSKMAHHLGRLHGLGTIRRPSHGRLQVTIDGHPLYFFVSDHTVTHAAGQHFGNVWFTVHPNGSFNRVVSADSSSKPGPTSPPPATPAPTSPPPPPPPTTSPPPTSTPTTVPPPMAPLPTSPPSATTPPTMSPPPPSPTTTTTTVPSAGGVGF